MAGIHYLKEKRNRKDYCNICGEYAPLTWDHVPPKGLTHGEAIIANTIFEKLPEPNSHMKRFQSGIKYRSICQKCNNEVLGENDMVYQEFITEVDKQIRSRLLLPKIIVPVKINRLCRAMTGHMLAAKNSFEKDVIPDQQMRDYVLNTDTRLHGIKIYAWLYPYMTIVIARDFVTMGFNQDSHPTGMISGIVLSWPLAYMVSDQENDCGIDDLGKYTTDVIDEEIEVTLHIESLYMKGSQEFKPFNWPINIGNDKSKSAMFALGGPVLQEDSRLGVKG